MSSPYAERVGMTVQLRRHPATVSSPAITALSVCPDCSPGIFKTAPIQNSDISPVVHCQECVAYKEKPVAGL
jgi:hypothetical protein